MGKIKNKVKAGKYITQKEIDKKRCNYESKNEQERLFLRRWGNIMNILNRGDKVVLTENRDGTPSLCFSTTDKKGRTHLWGIDKERLGTEDFDSWMKTIKEMTTGQMYQKILNGIEELKQ